MDLIKNWRLWITALRPFTFTTSILSIGLGTCLAVKVGYFSWWLLGLTLTGVLLLHGGTNLLNDYYDYQTGVDTAKSHGSSGVLPAGQLAPKVVKQVGVISFLLAVPIISYLVYLRGLIVLILTIIGSLGGYFYTAQPINYKYYALGVPLVFVLLGPMVVVGSYYVQVGSFNWQVVLISVPLGLLISAVLHSNDFRDIEADERVKIKTLAIILGRKIAGWLYLILVSLPYLVILGLIGSQVITPWAVLTLLTIPYAAQNIRLVNRSAANPDYELPKIDLKTAQLHFKFGLILLLTILGGSLFR